MDGLFGTEGSLIVRFVVAFVIVLALIGATFWVIRRFGGARVGSSAQRGRQPRLAVIDAAPVDGRRRLVLVRRDNVEHLLMIGGPADIVVEQNIVRAVPVTPPREVPVPRAPGIGDAAPPRTLADRAAAAEEDAWAPPPEAPVARPAYARPEPIPRARPPLERVLERASEPRGFETPPRTPLPPGLTPRPVEPRPVEPRSAEPRPVEPRPVEPRSIEPRSIEPRPLESRPFERPLEPRPLEPAAPAPIAPEPPGEPADAALASMAQRLEAALRRPGASEPRPPAPGVPAPDLAPAPAADHPEQSGAKPKSVLDSLEEEMASLLGRPSEKHEKQ
jgi:flagellar protein FliO/FliZ